MRPRSIGTISIWPPGASASTKSRKARGLRFLDTQEEEIRHRTGAPAIEERMQIAVDERQRHDQRKPEPEREDDDRRQCAGPVQIGDCEP